MTQENNNQTSSLVGNEWAEKLQQTVTSSVQGYNNLLRGLLLNEGYNGLWNSYIKGLIEVQNIVQKVNQTILQAYGLPTRADNSQINRQLYEINNRLDELEAKLAMQSERAFGSSEEAVAPVLEIAHS